MNEPAVRYRPPAPQLRPYITTYYWVDIPAAAGDQRDWLHPEWPNIRFLLQGRWLVASGGRDWAPAPPSALFGPTCRTVPVSGESPARLLGVGLLPVGFASLFDVQAASLVDRVEPLGDHATGVDALHAALADDKDDDAQAARLDAYFLAQMAARPPVSDVLRRAHAALLDPQIATVQAFADALDVCPRHLLRLCKRLFGFPPKLLLRRQRFLRTLEAAFAARDKSFAKILDAGYFDQSHFVRDFHQFVGFAPSHYFSLERPLQGVAMRERLKALGASFQGLQDARMRLAAESGSSNPPRRQQA